MQEKNIIHMKLQVQNENMIKIGTINKRQLQLIIDSFRMF